LNRLQFLLNADQVVSTFIELYKRTFDVELFRRLMINDFILHLSVRIIFNQSINQFLLLGRHSFLTLKGCDVSHKVIFCFYALQSFLPVDVDEVRILVNFSICLYISSVLSHLSSSRRLYKY